MPTFVAQFKIVETIIYYNCTRRASSSNAVSNFLDDDAVVSSDLNKTIRRAKVAVRRQCYREIGIILERDTPNHVVGDFYGVRQGISSPL